LSIAALDAGSTAVNAKRAASKMLKIRFPTVRFIITQHLHKIC
jgi:hypothetical protein